MVLKAQCKQREFYLVTQIFSPNAFFKTRRTFISGQVLMKLSFVIFLSFWRSLSDDFVTFPPKRIGCHVFMLSFFFFYFFNIDLSFSMIQYSLPLKPCTQCFTKIKTKPMIWGIFVKQISVAKCAICNVVNPY